MRPRRPALPLALAAFAALVAPAVAASSLRANQQSPTTPQGPPEDSLEILGLFVSELRPLSGHAPYDAFGDLLSLVDRIEWETQAESSDLKRRRALVFGLLDLAGVGLSPGALAPGARAVDAPRSSRFRRLGLDALRRLIAADTNGRALTWVSRDALMLLDRHPLERRLAALALVDELRPAGVDLALLTLVQVRRDPLRPAAFGLIADWPGAATDRFLVRQLARPRDPTGPHPYTLLLKRVREHGEPLAAGAAEELIERLGIMMLATDWRTTARAIQLARGIELEVRVPLMIESLRVWVRRGARGKGSRRIEADVLGELRAISRRSFGLDADRWRLWWRRVRTGEIPFVDRGDEPRPFATEAQFFGLRPVSDKITFVIDRSGSMDSEWGTTGRTRYQEAVEQLIQFLQASGDDVWFDVILFNHKTLRSSIGLRRATANHLELARRALLKEQVGGGTQLQPAIELSLYVENGAIDMDALEADTVIVLCDGQTEEGPHWVLPFLEHFNAEAQIKFHCVLMSGRGDGSLEQLASETHGDYIHIGG